MRAERRLALERAQRRRRLLLFGGAIAAALAVAVALIVANRPGSGSGLPAITIPADAYAGIPASGRTLGNPNAPVQVVEWGDYQCPGCGQFARSTQPQLVRDYVASGKVAFTFRDFPFLDQGRDTAESHRAAEASVCANDQGKFWPFHDALYANQHDENGGSFAAARLKQIGAKLGLDAAKFDACVDGRTHANEVAGSYTEGTQQYRVNSTPTLFVNGRNINYQGDYAGLKAAIDAVLPK